MAAKKPSAKNKKNKISEQRQIAKEVFGVVLIMTGILFGICVFSASNTVVLLALRKFAFGVFGVFGYVCPFMLAFLGFLEIFHNKINLRASAVVMGIVGVLALLALIHSLCPYGKDVSEGFSKYILTAYQKGYENIVGGGVTGSLLSYPAVKFIGVVGGSVVFVALMILSVMTVCRISLKNIGTTIGRSVSENAKRAAEKIREERPAREERLRQKVEREAFTYESEPEEREYPKGTAFDENLSEEKYEEPAKEKYEEAAQEDFYDEYEDEDDEKSFMFDKQSDYDVNDESLVEGGEYIAAQDSELDLSGLRIIDKMHGRDSDEKKASFNKVKKSYDYTVDSQDGFIYENYDEPEEEKTYEHEEYSYPGLYENADNKEKTPQEEEISYTKDIVGTKAKEELSSEKKEEVAVFKPSLDEKTASKEKKKFRFPSVELLDKPSGTDRNSAASRNEIDENARKLEDVFSSFGVDVKVVDALVGPKVTRYELQPAPGVKISRIKSLSDDIALNMAAKTLRIEAPVPGKSVIGIELPNKYEAGVLVRELIDCPEFRNFTAELPFALGKDISGKKLYDDLAKMPHLLVAGTTGSGKSVCLNVIILSLIYKLPPEELQFIIVDPKQVEFSVYNGIPYLKVPVIEDKSKAAGALVWAVKEMEKRYNLLKLSGVRNIKSYNQKRKEAGEEIMPKLVIVIDEFAELMMVSPKDVEDAVCRIAQLGRAAGIHLIIATQSPRADIFTGLIKANVPSRIALTVGSPLESRIIMDEMGAEKLLGKGDMLYRPIGKNKSTRIQGGFVSDDDVMRVTDYLRGLNDERYDDDVDVEMAKLAEQTGKNKAPEEAYSAENDDMDELLPKAVKTVLEFEQASASMLQRKMRVGYSRAARLMDQLEEIGVVGPSEGSKGRQILWTWADYNEHFSQQNDNTQEDGNDGYYED